MLISLLAIGSCCFLSAQGMWFQEVDPVYKEYVNTTEHPGNRCNRVCRHGDNRICYFEFTLEFYHAMGSACGKCKQGVEKDCNNPQCVVGDGWEKGVMSINRQVPGPSIQVCKDDIVIVDVHNKAHGTADALHWHGMHMVDTPYMDGVPFITQCPISYSSSFRYQFRATQAGTQFYHSHAGHHKANGEYGALIVREPENNRSKSLYDHDLPEHYIFITDWMHTPAEQQFPGLVTHDGVFADSIVINGRGVFTDPRTFKRNKVRPTIFYVTPDQRYRFRLINSMNHACPVQMQIENHNFTVIASDSCAVEAETFDTLVSNSGERYDFVLEANQGSGDFWLRAIGLGACAARPTESYILIRYNTSEELHKADDFQIPQFPHYNEVWAIKSALNHPKTKCFHGNGSKCVIELSGTKRDQELLAAEPDYKFFLGFDNYNIPNEQIHKPGQYLQFVNTVSNLTVVGGINNMSLVFPDYALLTQPDLADSQQFCDAFQKPDSCADQRVCHCIHRLKVALNSIVELILVDETASVNPIQHPFHLHGYHFMVIGMGQQPNGNRMSVEAARKMDNKNMLRRSLSNPRPPFKDTLSIPSRGYAIVRLRARNPGFWLMHCHYEWHMAIGMGLVFQVGETSEMVKPPCDFPKCSSYIPKAEKPSALKHLTNNLLNLFNTCT